MELVAVRLSAVRRLVAEPMIARLPVVKVPVPCWRLGWPRCSPVRPVPMVRSASRCRWRGLCRCWRWTRAFLPGIPAVPGGLAGTLALVQALGDAGIDAPLWTVTSGAVAAVPGEKLVSPAQGAVWGLARCTAQEYRERWGGLIDLPPVLDERAVARLCAVLAGCGEDEVAIRPAGIFGRRLVRAPRPREEASWSPRGTVLITGGTGALGGHTARWLAAHGAARVILVSRSGLARPGGGAGRAAGRIRHADGRGGRRCRGAGGGRRAACPGPGRN